MIKTAPKKNRIVEESRELRFKNFKAEGKNFITFKVKQLKGYKYKDETVCVY